MTQNYITTDQFDSFLTKFDDFVTSVNMRFDSIDNRLDAVDRRLVVIEKRLDAVETLVKENKASISSLCKVFDAVISDKAA